MFCLVNRAGVKQNQQKGDQHGSGDTRDGDFTKRKSSIRLAEKWKVEGVEAAGLNSVLVDGIIPQSR